MQTMNYIVTMTSWKKRIQYVKNAIEKFLQNTPVYIDKFYLWLAEEEFPSKEADLPAELVKFVYDNSHVEITWTKYNEYCHKRWYVYPEHFENCVISIDDDAYYNRDGLDKAIAFALKNKCIVNLADLFYSNVFNHSIHKEVIHWYSKEPSKYTVLCGQCIIPPHVFPLECLNEDNIRIRSKICKRCDESWINPWLIKTGINIYTPDYIVSQPTEYESRDAMWKIMAEYKNKFSFRDIQLFVVLNKFPELYESWICAFPGYKKIKEDVQQIYDWAKTIDPDITVKDIEKIPDYIRNH